MSQLIQELHQKSTNSIYCDVCVCHRQRVLHHGVMPPQIYIYIYLHGKVTYNVAPAGNQTDAFQLF